VDNSQNSNSGQNSSPNVVFGSDGATGKATQTATSVGGEVVQQATVGAKIVTDQHLLLQAVSATGDPRDNVTVSLPSDAIDRLPSVLKNLPDGHYRVLFEQGQQQSRRQVFEIYMRQGRAVNSEDELQGDVDRPALSQAEDPTQPVVLIPDGQGDGLDWQKIAAETLRVVREATAEQARQLAIDSLADDLEIQDSDVERVAREKRGVVPAVDSVGPGTFGGQRAFA
jgi:hypothetical protein